MTSRQLILLLVVLIGIGILFTAGKLLMPGTVTEIPTPTPTESTTPVSVGTFTVRLGAQIGTMGIAITPLEVLEDSRCGVDVVCIQAGTVRLRAKVNQGEMTFTLNQPVTIESKSVTLTEVQPAPYAGRQISKTDYRFTFQIK
jgi:hypothetical protein